MALPHVIAALEKQYGTPAVPPVSEAFELILYENVAYLVSDEKREAVWKVFKKRVGSRPEKILDTDAAELALIIKDGGMQPAMRAQKLRRSARICLDSFDGDLAPVLKGPVNKARSALKKFPGIGEPGADKVLLLTRTAPILALDSNALRVLIRLGYGEDTGNYAATYREVHEAVAPEIGAKVDERDFGWLIKAHQLLRLHGQTLCKRKLPKCEQCPLVGSCPTAKLAPEER